MGVALADQLQPVHNSPGILGEVAAEPLRVRAALAAQPAQQVVPFGRRRQIRRVGFFLSDARRAGLLEDLALLLLDRVDDLAGLHRLRRADSFEHAQDLGELVALGVGRPGLVEQGDDVGPAREDDRPGDEAVPLLEGPEGGAVRCGRPARQGVGAQHGQRRDDQLAAVPARFGLAIEVECPGLGALDLGVQVDAEHAPGVVACDLDRIARCADDRAGRRFDLGVAAQQAVAVDGRGQVVRQAGRGDLPAAGDVVEHRERRRRERQRREDLLQFGFVVEDVGVHQDGVGAQRDDRDGVEELGLAGAGLDGVVHERGRARHEVPGHQRQHLAHGGIAIGVRDEGEAAERVPEALQRHGCIVPIRRVRDRRERLIRRVVDGGRRNRTRAGPGRCRPGAAQGCG